MVCCAITNCTSDSNKVGAVNRGISFFRFPKDPRIKNKWIEATGRKNWFPTKSSRICSIHFHEDTFTGPSKYRRVIITAYPTIDVVLMSNDEKIKGQSSSEKDTKNNTPRKRKLEMNTHEPSKSDEVPLHTPKKEKILYQLNNARQMIKQKDKQIKRLKEQNRRKVSTPPQVQDEKNNVPLMMIKMEPYTMNNEPDAVSNEATEPKRCRPNTPDSHASMSLQDSITTLNNILSKEKIEDDCDIYGKLLATKLRRYPENERLKMMYKIDGMLISQPPPQPAHSVLREHCSQPTINTIELDHSHPSSSTYKPEQTRVYSKTRKVASSTIEITPEAEETILPTALSDIESIEVKSEQMDEHCMTFEAEDEELI